MQTEIEINDEVIEIELDYYWQNDSIDYEFWGSKESIKGEDYPVIQKIIWDESLYSEEMNKQIKEFVYSEKMIEKLDKKLCDYVNSDNY